MNGHNDQDRLAEARAAQAAFNGRSPDSRGHVARGGRVVTGRARNGNNPNNNMITAGRGRGGPPTLTSGGPGSFGGNNTARVGGSGGRNGPATPLATSDEFLAFMSNNKKTNVPTGGSAAVSGANGAFDAPNVRKTVAQNANSISGRGTVDLDSSMHVRSHASPFKPEGPKRGLMSSQWAQSTSPPPPSVNPSELQPIYRSDNWIEDLQRENEADAKRQAALASAATPGNARGPNTQSAIRASAASSVGALAQTRAIKRPAQGAAAVTANIGAPQQANNIQARPAPASGGAFHSQAHTQRPNVIQPGTQPVGQQNLGFSQGHVGAAHPVAGPTQAYQPLAARPPTQGQTQQAQGAATLPVVGAHASPNGQPLRRGDSGGTPSFAGFGAGPTAQSLQQPSQPIGNNIGQQPPQAARPADGTRQQSAQSAQRSQNPFDDETFKHFWENEYMPNNR